MSLRVYILSKDMYIEKGVIGVCLIPHGCVSFPLRWARCCSCNFLLHKDTQVCGLPHTTMYRDLWFANLLV